LEADNTRSLVLQISSLNSYYSDCHTLQGVDLGIAPGSVVGLMGRNGMGKTTLIRSPMGYVPAARAGLKGTAAPSPGARPSKQV
jgi:branched-chain amino acid transport system ATP-binding protein